MEDKNDRVWAYTDSNLQHLQNNISIFNYESKKYTSTKSKRKKERACFTENFYNLTLNPKLNHNPNPYLYP